MRLPPFALSLFCRVALISLCIHVAACSGHSVTLSRWQLSDIEMGQSQTLAIISLPGPASADWAALMEHEVLQLPFDVVSPLHGEGVSHVASARDIDEALQIGRQEGADTVVAASVKVTLTPVDQTSIAQDDGSVQGVKFTACVHGTLAVLDVVSGRTIIFEPVHHTYTPAQYLTEDAEQELSANHHDILRLNALQDFAHILAHRMVPHQISHDVTLFADTALPDSERAIATLIQGDWLGAVAIYRAGIAQMNVWTTPKWLQARAHYNLGTTLAFGGETQEGLKHLLRAQTLYPSPLCEQQIQRVQTGEYGSTVAPKHRMWNCYRHENNTPDCLAQQLL